MSESATTSVVIKRRSGVLAFLAGLAADFWKDGPTPEFWLLFVEQIRKTFEKLTMPKTKETAKSFVAQKDSHIKIKKYAAEPGVWSADYPQILNELWGKGHHLPGGDAVIDAITTPLGLSSDMNVLDLSAGMGALGRRLTVTLNTYVTGLEEDETLIAQGMEISNDANMAAHAPLTLYDPATFIAEKRYHCILARELFFRVENKPKFLVQVGKSLLPRGKPRGQMVFTDYCLEEADRKKPAIQAWLAEEADAKPVSLSSMVKLLSKLGMDVRVTEDWTPRQLKYVTQALSDFAIFLQGHPPVPETKIMVAQEIKRWGLRVAAMKQGLKFYRFYAIKN